MEFKARALIDIIRINPFRSPPPYEKLVGGMRGAYFRRLTIKPRLAYEVNEESRTVKIISMWSHYEF